MENEELEKEQLTNEAEETAMTVIKDFKALGKRTNTKQEVFTNITDQKKMFNLDNKVDNLLNDCEGELIRVKEVLIKRFEKPLVKPKIIKQAEVDKETGEVLKEAVIQDTEVTMACILVDDNNKSYATGSKIFTIAMMRYLQMFGISPDGFEIKIVKNKTDNGNKSLGFELV